MRKLSSFGAISIITAAIWALPVYASTCKVNDQSTATSYEGGCKNGLANGKGTAKGDDIYTGEFLNGNKHGTGTYTWAAGGSYTGQWENDNFNGTGTLTLPSGSTYIGQFKNGLKQGNGKYTWPNGDYYEGEWANDKKNGQGIATFKKGGTDPGEWRDDKLVRRIEPPKTAVVKATELVKPTLKTVVITDFPNAKKEYLAFVAEMKNIHHTKQEDYDYELKRFNSLFETSQKHVIECYLFAKQEQLDKNKLHYLISREIVDLHLTFALARDFYTELLKTGNIKEKYVMVKTEFELSKDLNFIKEDFPSYTHVINKEKLVKVQNTASKIVDRIQHFSFTNEDGKEKERLAQDMKVLEQQLTEFVNYKE